MTESTTSPAAVGVPQISVILPTHNELRLLGTTVANIVAALNERALHYEILIVENGSTDGTLRLARLLCAQLAGVRVLTLPTGNYGLALRTGFEAARGDVVVNFDVDYYDFSFLDQALALMSDGSDVVLASKRAEGSSDRRPLVRRVLTAVFTRALQAVLDLEVTDAHGMKSMRRESLLPIVDECTMTGSLFDVEMVIRAMKAGRKVTEVPAIVEELRPPRTSLWKRSIESFIGMMRLRWSLRTPR